MNNELVFNNYKQSLKQKYNAVCFDIDGTLTCDNSKKIDDNAIDMIIGLLKKKIPVVFITGRGETGLNDLKEDIYDSIEKTEKIPYTFLKRIYVLTNDGARMFYSDTISKDEFLKQNIYISNQNELNQLSEVNKLLKNVNSKYFNLNYSTNLKTGTIINIRMVFNTENDLIINLIFDNIKKFINDNKYSSIHLTRGIYKNKAVIQIGTATKDKAIEKTEKIIGVPQNSMIRIGDCGDVRGNDYAMLNCSQGYSVDKVNGDINSCFPIFDDEGNILHGVFATLYLVKHAKILPTVCLEKPDKKQYTYEFAGIEKDIVLGRNELLNKYNFIINNNFNDINGIDSLFDKFSGSIKIPMYDWELLKDNSLKELWLSSSNGNLEYSIRDDNDYLLRGSDTYYYFLSNRISKDGKDITTKKDIITWHKNNLKFLDDSLVALLSATNINEKTNKKLLLGILDNCRNILLVIMNHKLVSNYFDKNILLDISSKDNKDMYSISNNLLQIEYLMSNICFKQQYIIKLDDIFDGINKTKHILQDNLRIENVNVEKEDYSKDYRAYREIDNYGENYIAVSLYDEKCSSKYSNSCGLSYGGIELPIISKIINRDRVEKLLLLKFNKEVSGYSNKQLIDLRKFNINDCGGLIGCGDIFKSSVDLFDDNVLTGKTLQLAINALYDSGIKTNNICIVRYPSLNRVDQMFFNNNPAAVDYHLFFDYIYGLCFSSPYTWKDNGWINSNGKIDFSDTLGVFDLNRKKIVECLIKNHSFNENSEVGEYKRRLVK